MIRRWILHVLCLSASLAACRQASAPGPATATTARALPAPDSPYATIWVAQSGTIELNGERVGIEALEPALADLVRRKGVVLYGRDAPEGEPHPNAMKVVEMVVANRLPIRMSTMRDYADAIGPDGKLTQ